jgi:hypothetical protein
MRGVPPVQGVSTLTSAGQQLPVEAPGLLTFFLFGHTLRHPKPEQVNLAGEAGLQVLLDLHGAPGGENALRPCGRENARWAYHDWRMQVRFTRGEYS